MAIDFVEIPPKFPVSDTHWAKTWLLDERAPELTKPEGIQDLHDKWLKFTQKKEGLKDG
jgi:oligopeptide transport system ATP-binding protein